MDLSPSAFARRVDGAVKSLQRQAPGARMVGEFAVKQATAILQRLIRPDRRPQP